jgi:N-acetylmuramoyl-L-alanine amidase
MLLKLNVKNPRVKELQKLLNSLGFVIAKTGPGSVGKETDFFGSLTESAVKGFQKSNGLKDDGIVGPRTWSKLVEKEKLNIKPIYDNKNTSEDFSDPEEKITIPKVKEESPTSPNITELIALIQKSKITRNVTRLVFHCTASSQTSTVSGIEKYWKETLGWKSPGYHIIVKPDGSWVQLSDFNNITNGVKGINSTSLHISYIGGIDSKGKPLDNRTKEQKEIFETVYRTFKEKMPSLTFHAHYEFTNKACPSFDVKKWIDSLEKI